MEADRPDPRIPALERHEFQQMAAALESALAAGGDIIDITMNFRRAMWPGLRKDKEPSFPPMRYAIIEYDPEKLSKLQWSAEGSLLAHILINAMQAKPYAKERSVNSIVLTDEPPIIVPPINVCKD